MDEIKAQFPNRALRELKHDQQTLGKQPVGKIIAILQRDDTAWIGRIQWPQGTTELRANDHMIAFYPNDARYPRFYIPRNQLSVDMQRLSMDKVKKILVQCRFHQWKAHAQTPLCRFVNVVGQYGNVGDELRSILLQQDIVDTEFSKSIVKSLTRYRDWTISKAELRKRRDLRRHRIFTVDPYNARDLDDALHITKLDDGTFEVGVHIADVSYFVVPGSKLDAAAAQRATTVYLIDRIIPMLPRILCENLCSLNPQTDRLAYSVIWRMHPDGTRVENAPVWYGRTVIRSCCKLDYGTAQRMVDGEITVHDSSLWEPERRPSDGHKMKDVIQDVIEMNRLAQNRRRLRFQNGGLALDGIKLTFALDEKGNPIDVSPYPIRQTNQMIEEYMLLANFLVAEKLLLVMGQKAFLRRHEEPVQAGLERVAIQAKTKGIVLDIQSAQGLHDSLKNVPTEHLAAFRALLTSPMKLAEYCCAASHASWDHYALHIPYYTHFTSPIRRYADVMVHRLLTAALTPSHDISYTIPELQAIADNCNTRNNASKTAQDQCDRLYLALYLRQQPKIVEAQVMGLGEKSFTVFVEEYGIEERLFVDRLGCKGVWNDDTHTLTIESNDKQIRCKLSLLSRVKFRMSAKDQVPIGLQFDLVEQ